MSSLIVGVVGVRLYPWQGQHRTQMTIAVPLPILTSGNLVEISQSQRGCTRGLTHTNIFGGMFV